MHRDKHVVGVVTAKQQVARSVTMRQHGATHLDPGATGVASASTAPMMIAIRSAVVIMLSDRT
jgi:hypothetical protein